MFWFQKIQKMFVFSNFFRNFKKGWVFQIYFLNFKKCSRFRKVFLIFRKKNPHWMISCCLTKIAFKILDFVFQIHAGTWFSGVCVVLKSLKHDSSAGYNAYSLRKRSRVRFEWARLEHGHIWTHFSKMYFKHVL